MKNMIIVCAIIAAIGFWTSEPSTLPTAYLDVYENGRHSESGAMIGGKCISGKCLTVYVAPWCPACKGLTPTINKLANELEAEGISTQIIVGYDKLAKVKAYSKRYTLPIYEDANASFYQSADISGVPYFAITDVKGDIVNDMSGGYKSVETMRKMLQI